MLVSVYTLAHEEEFNTYLVLTLYTSTERSWIFGISLGDDTHPDQRARRGFNAVAWRRNPCHPFSAGILAASWDEAWKLACTIGCRLGVVDIQLRYGG